MPGGGGKGGRGYEVFVSSSPRLLPRPYKSFGDLGSTWLAVTRGLKLISYHGNGTVWHSTGYTARGAAPTATTSTRGSQGTPVLGGGSCVMRISTQVRRYVTAGRVVTGVEVRPRT